MHCPACGVEQTEGAKFCKSCGQPMAGIQSQPAAAASPLAGAVPTPAYPPPAYPAPAAGPARGKQFIILGIVFLVVIASVGVVLLLALGGEEGVAGAYYSKIGESSLELRPDGTFTINAGGIELEGTYEVRGDELTLTFSYFGMENEVEGTITGGSITIEDEVYQKR